MGVLQLDDTPVKTDNRPFRTQEELKTSTLFNEELSVEKIKYNVDGMRWTVDYFNQILNINSQPLAPDVNVSSTVLKYNRVSKLDLFVDSGLPASTVLDITGTGTINAGFVPYIGDAFTATLAGGRIGIFVLTDVRKEYYNTHDIFIVDYKLTYFADTSAAEYNDLVYKTVRTYVYDKDAINTFSNPVILAKDYIDKLDLTTQPAKIMEHYLDIFHDKDTNYLRLPTQSSTYVDQLVSNAIFSIVSINEVPDLAKITRIDKDITSVTIWDALLNRDMDLFDICNTNIKYGINAVGGITTRRLNSYLGVTYMVTDNASSVRVTPDVEVNPLTARKVVTSPITSKDGMYIFSDVMYNNSTAGGLTSFETVVMEYLRGETPNRELVSELLREYKYWEYEDQYTLVPVLLLLVKTLINNNYSSI